MPSSLLSVSSHFSSMSALAAVAGATRHATDVAVQGQIPLGVILSIVAVVLLVVVVIVTIVLVSLWKIFQKAGLPGWTALIPLYNTVKQLDLTGRPRWWVLMMFVPVVNVVLGINVLYRLVRAFGKTGWFAVGVMFLPFVFLPILAFGKATYTKVYPDPAAMSDATMWALLAFALLYAGGIGPTVGSVANTHPLTILGSDDGGYATDGQYVYHYDHVLSGADPETFSILSANYSYSKDADAVYYDEAKIIGADPKTFVVVTDSDVYDAKDASRYYNYGEPVTTK